MDTSDFVELGAGLALGGMMSRAIGNAFTNALDAHTSIKVIAVPQTRGNSNAAGQIGCAVGEWQNVGSDIQNVDGEMGKTVE